MTSLQRLLCLQAFAGDYPIVTVGFDAENFTQPLGLLPDADESRILSGERFVFTLYSVPPRRCCCLMRFVFSFNRLRDVCRPRPLIWPLR